MDDPDNVQEEEIVSTCRLFLSNVRSLRRTVAAKEEELDGCCCSSSSGEVVNDDKSTAVFNQTIRKEDKLQLKQDLKEWFQQYGDVVEVFLPDRVAVTTKSSNSNNNNKKKKKKQPYAFVTMATPESAQLAISDNKNNRKNSHSTKTEEYNTNTSKSTRNTNDKQQQQLRIRNNKCHLFDDCVPAPPSIRNKRQQKKVKSENQNHVHVQDLLQTSNIICQLSKSHLQRFQDYVLLYSEQQQSSKEEINSNRESSSEVHGRVIGWIKTDSKTMVLVFLYSTQPKQFLFECILKDWFVRPIIHRTMIIQQSQIFPLSCPPDEEEENEKKSALFVGKLLDGIKLGIYNTIKSHIDTAGSLTATTCANRSSSGSMATPQQQSNQSPLRVRLQLFPPRLLQPLLERLQNTSYHGNDSHWEVFNINNCVEFTPTNATHTLTITRISETAFAMGGLEKNVVGNSPIPTPNVYERKKEGKNSQVLSGNSNITKNRKTKKDGNYTAICRAHWKLQEAFERYRYELPSDPKIALDCGSAPGGWTRCLDDIFSKSCQRIYSVDPGEMDDSVLQIPIVQHIPMTIQNAFTWLSKQKQQQQCNDRSNLLLQQNDEGNISNTDTHISSSSLTINQSNNPVHDCHCPIIDVWVSDMCVKDMEQQVTLFLQARELGIAGSGTFFVLTLKCIVGNSDATFDLLCQKQVQGRLQPVSRNLHQLHLFTNRISERTVMGYLK